MSYEIKKVNEIVDLNEIKKLTKEITTVKYDDEYVYHYTSVSSLFSIIGNETLWLCNVYSSNDPVEGKMKFTEFLNNIKNHVIESEQNYSDSYVDNINEKVIKLIELSPKRNFKKQFRYGISFSREYDKLSQWERYTDLKGVCIRFNLKKLKEQYLSDVSRLLFNNILSFDEMIYKSNFDTDFVAKEIDAYYNLYDKIYVKYSKNHDKPNDELIRKYHKNLLKVIYLHYISVHKNAYFEDEGEIRLSIPDDFHKHFILNSIDKEIGKKVLNLVGLDEKKYNVINGLVKSHYEIDISEALNNGFIDEVTLGPHCMQNIDELKLFLKSKKLNIPIKLSQVKIN